MPPLPAPRSSTAATPPISRISTPATRPTRSAVDAEWQAFFQSLKDERAAMCSRAPAGRPGSGRTGRSAPRGELVSALDGDWREVEKAVGDKVKARAQAGGVELSPADVQQATRDSIRALMLIRAYRARGHFHANLDPLGLEPQQGRAGPRSALLRLYRRRHGSADLPRPRARARVRHLARDPRHPAPHLLPDARRRVHAHLRSRAEGLDAGAHRGARQGDQLHPRGQARHPQQADRGRRLREILRSQVHRHQALRARRRRIDDPGARADHQARRRARRQRHRASAWPTAAGSTCWRR